MRMKILRWHSERISGCVRVVCRGSRVSGSLVYLTGRVTAIRHILSGAVEVRLGDLVVARRE